MQMAGAPGTGKSAVARAVAASRSAIVVDVDVVKSAVLDAGVAWDLAGRASYSVVFALADDFLAQGHSTIIDSPSHYAQTPEQGEEVARTRGAAYRFVECYCDDLDEVARRLGKREPRRSQLRSLSEWPAEASGVPTAEATGAHRWKTYGPAGGHLLVDTCGPLKDVVARVQEYLDAPRFEDASTRATHAVD